MMRDKDTFTVPAKYVRVGQEQATAVIGLMVETQDDAIVFINGITIENAKELVEKLTKLIEAN